MVNWKRPIFLIPLIISFSFSSLYAQSSYRNIAKYLAQKAFSQNRTKVAVLTYSPMGEKKIEGGEEISEEIIIELVNNSNINVVERSQVQKLLKELQFNQTGAIDAAAAKKIGNGLGADALVIGSFTYVNDREMKLYTKLVDTETFRVLGARQDVIKITSGTKISRIEKEEQKPDVLINRRVLILDFVNINDSPDYKYLEKSIPESFLDSLDKTRKFELMDRSIWVDAVKSGKYNPKDADNEKIVVELGRQNEADVVLVGSFVVVKNQMQIFAKAIELSSKRAMVSRNVTTPLDNRIFDRIKRLTSDMSDQMKEKLPPLPQKVITIERRKYASSNPFVTAETNYVGMLWRTAAMPGWGHLYADQWRGWVYMPLWAGALGTFVYGVIDYEIKNETYQNASSGLEAAYADMKDARLLRNVAFVSLLGVYTITIADMLITGKLYEPKALSYNNKVNFYAFILPSVTNDKYNSNGDLYVHFGARTRF